MRKNRKDEVCDAILALLLRADATTRRLSAPHKREPTQEQCASVRIGLQKMTMKELVAILGMLR